jgi:hypothetical protein
MKAFVRAQKPLLPLNLCLLVGGLLTRLVVR